MTYNFNTLIDIVLCMIFYGALPLIGIEAFRRTRHNPYGIFFGTLSFLPLLAGLFSFPHGNILWVVVPLLLALSAYLYITGLTHNAE